MGLWHVMVTGVEPEVALDELQLCLLVMRATSPSRRCSDLRIFLLQGDAAGMAPLSTAFARQKLCVDLYALSHLIPSLSLLLSPMLRHGIAFFLVHRIFR